MTHLNLSLGNVLETILSHLKVKIIAKKCMSMQVLKFVRHVTSLFLFYNGDCLLNLVGLKI